MSELTSPVVQEISERLSAALQPYYLDVKDEGDEHIGHQANPPSKGHYAVTIESDEFKGKTPVQQHRLVHKALGELMSKSIHALRIIIRE